MSSQVRHYKKYANRKFYDVDKGEYVSVEDIARVVRGGEDVEMVSDRTGQDLTREILARILYEELRKLGKTASREKAGEPAKFVRRESSSGPAAAEIAKLIRKF
jgi:siroheme synthase